MKCRHCANELSIPFLDLGNAPPSNAYLSSEDLSKPELWFPLRIMVCEKCWLVQTEDHAGRELLFTKNYAYFSSFSTTWLEHVKQYVGRMIERFNLNTNSFVLEVAANDGYLLQYVQKAGIPCFGIEPTRSTAAAARDKGINIIESFFGMELAVELAHAGNRADLIIANNVLAHVPDINDFVSGFNALLKPQGVVTFEFPHLLRMIQENQFDTIYHEHYSYLSLTAVQRIFTANKLIIFDVEELSTHGGSLRVFAQRADTGTYELTPAVKILLEMEKAAGMISSEFYCGFQLKVEKLKNDLVYFLINAKRCGLKVGAYGAAAKGNTVINFAGIRPDLLPYVVDKNPAKQGNYMPGSRIPIVDESYLRIDQPNLILILPWNLRDEIIAQLEYAQEWGAKFVIAAPELEVLRG